MPLPGSPKMQELRQPTPHCQGSVTTRTRPHARLRVELRAFLGSGASQHVRPVRRDQGFSNLAADECAQLVRNGAGVDDMEALRWQVPDTGDELESEERRDGEDIVGEAAGVSRTPSARGERRSRDLRPGTGSGRASIVCSCRRVLGKEYPKHLGGSPLSRPLVVRFTLAGGDARGAGPWPTTGLPERRRVSQASGEWCT